MCHPVPLSLFICDHIWRDPHTGKLTILGMFSEFASPSFPCKINLTAYFAVTDGLGVLPIRIELTDVDDDGPAISDAQGLFLFCDRRQVIEGAFECSLNIDQPGEYRLKLFAADEFLMERSLTAIEINKCDGAKSV